MQNCAANQKIGSPRITIMREETIAGMQLM
jgi:hypothetical protein